MMTNEIGMQVCVRRVVALPLRQLWNLMCSEEGIKMWLGTTKNSFVNLDCAYKTKEGVSACIVSFKLYSHICLKWVNSGCDHESILRIMVFENMQGDTTLCFQHESLKDVSQYEMMVERWSEVLLKIEQSANNEQLSQISIN